MQCSGGTYKGSFARLVPHHHYSIHQLGRCLDVLGR